MTLADVDAWVRQRNEAYVRFRLRELKTWADERFDRPLTEQQRRAIIVDEDCNLVVAGAGSGKTTSILAKIAYLTEHRHVAPSDILVLAFNSTVATEIRDRVREVGVPSPEISTFHAKGYEILGRARGRKPAISALAEDPKALHRFLQDRFESRLTDVDFLERFSKWWVDRRVEASDIRAETPDERLRKESSIGLRTLNGTWVRSQSEVKVGDWLTLQGIRWNHEPRYPHSPPNPNRRDYTPDFHLPDQEIWIEVWSCDRSEERFPPEYDKDRYKADMTWKRKLHAAHKTHLLEIFQDDIWNRDLSGVLSQKLAAAGVQLAPLTPKAIAAILALAQDSFASFVNILAGFLRLFRAGGWTREGVEARARSDRDRDYLTLFWLFFDDYSEALLDENKIDFEEMLLTAVRELQDGISVASYRYILVDEYQDASRTRVALISGLRGAPGSCRLFLVGDDWQAIYRFTGADIDFFTQVEKHLGATERTDLDRSFRLLSDVAAASTHFITRNPIQLPKELAARGSSEADPGISIHFHAKEDEHRTLTSLLNRITGRAGADAHVLVLARYNYRLELLDGLVPSTAGSGPIQRLTVHRSKGLEADHVVVLGLDSGQRGFPSGIEDDRVLHLVLSAEGTYPNAEERRLFYVALTRTRGSVHLLADTQNPSPFVQELLGEQYADWVELFGEESERYLCPRCEGKTIRQSVGPHGSFWACINYSACRGRLPICPLCEAGVLRPPGPNQSEVHFSCSECGYRAEKCPRCGNGALIAKDGRRGRFLGCSEWRRDESGCALTMDLT